MACAIRRASALFSPFGLNTALFLYPRLRILAYMPCSMVYLEFGFYVWSVHCGTFIKVHMNFIKVLFYGFEFVAVGGVAGCNPAFGGRREFA